METRTYADLYELIEGLCGVSFAAVEQPRIRALVNRRATKAYRATNFWPRSKQCCSSSGASMTPTR